MTVDVLGLDALLREFREAPKRLQRDAERAVKRAAVEVKRDAVKRVRAGLSSRGYSGGHSHLPHYPKSIDFDQPTKLEALVGPKRGLLQGAFGRGVEFGSSRAAPIPHMLPAADDQDAPFQAAMKAAMDAAL